MSDKKNIERIFQERFKDFEAMPPSQSWDAIASRLEHKKSKKRVIPFWYQMAGVAALLLSGYFVSDYYISSPSKTLQDNKSNAVTNLKEESRKNANSDGLIKYSSEEANTKESIAVSTDADTSKESNYNNNNSNTRLLLNRSSRKIKISEGVVENNTQQNDQTPLSNNIKSATNPTKIKNGLSAPSKNSIVENINKRNSTNRDNLNTKIRQKKSSNSNIALVSDEKISNNNVVDIKGDKHQENVNKLILKKEISNSEDTVVKTAIAQNRSLINDENDLIQTKSLNQIAGKEKVQSQDSILNEVATINPLALIEKEKENTIKKDNVAAIKSNKWKIKPNMAPIVMRATNGSPIASQFKDNEKNYENTLSIGIGVDYAVSKKIAIRASVNKFNLAYNTADIAYYADINDSYSRSTNKKTVIKNINLNEQSKDIIIEDKNNQVPTQNLTQISSDSNLSEIAKQDKNEGYLNQQMGYVEVPVEIAYKLIDKKFGIQVFTGLSTLFLNENKISVVSSEFTNNIGEAKNLNKVHYSTNVGLAFKYSFTNTLEANFEPTLKYQFNTFTANSGNFNPYLVGFYTALSFAF
jgi:hypothetical protein